MMHLNDATLDSTPLDAQAADVLARLRAEGYAHLAAPVSEAEFKALSARLGTVVHRTDIKVDAAQRAAQAKTRAKRQDRPGVYQAEGLSLHTDSPRIDVLGWYCVEQDAEDGASLLIDGARLADYFSEEERQRLGTIQVTYFIDEAGALTEGQAPLLSHNGTDYQLYYIPWNLAAPRDDAEARLLERFADAVRQEWEQRPIRIRLEDRTCLFIDNRRMLHGRGTISATSTRHLVRLYLRVPALRG